MKFDSSAELRETSLGEQRIPGLDALRGIAAFGVVVLHYRTLFDAGPDLLVLYPAYKGGSFFVDLFFVLSGFLLTQVYAHISSYRELVVRRFSRLFPLQWLTLFVVLLGQTWYASVWGKPFIYPLNDAYHFVLNVFLLQQVGLQSGFSFNGPSWSISVEWVINLLFFAFLVRPRLVLPAAIVIAFSSALALALTQTSIDAFGRSFGVIENGLLRVGFGFFVGVIAAKLALQYQHANRLRIHWDWIALCAGLVLIYFLGSEKYNQVLFLQLLAVGLVMPVLVMSCAMGKNAGLLLSAPPFVWLGDISYSVYLTHFPILLLIFLARNHLPMPLNSGEGMLTVMLIVAIVSHLVFRYFERPAQRRLRSLLSGKSFVRSLPPLGANDRQGHIRSTKPTRPR